MTMTTFSVCLMIDDVQKASRVVHASMQRTETSILYEEALTGNITAYRAHV